MQQLIWASDAIKFIDRHVLTFLYEVFLPNLKMTELRRKHHGAVDKSPSKQQVCVTDDNWLCCAKNWTPHT